MKAKPISTMIYSAEFPFGGWVEIVFYKNQTWHAEYVNYSPGGGYILERKNVRLFVKKDVFERDFEVIDE